MPLRPNDIIYFDGGASPNPGPMTVAVVCGEDRLLLRLDELVGGNEAEFRAAQAALDYAAANARRRPVIAGDSDAVVTALGGRPPKQGRLTQLYEECIVKDRAVYRADWRHVPRDNPAGKLIQAERRAEKAARKRARRSGSR